MFEVISGEFSQILQRDVETMDNRNQIHHSVLVSADPTFPHTTDWNESLVPVPSRALTYKQVTPSCVVNGTSLRSKTAAANHCVV